MSHFYLQVDRLDEKAACVFFYPLGSQPGNVMQELETRLDFYRQQGFTITDTAKNPLCKHATREDGVKLELLVVMKKTPLPMSLNVDWRGGDTDAATVH